MSKVPEARELGVAALRLWKGGGKNNTESGRLGFVSWAIHQLCDLKQVIALSDLKFLICEVDKMIVTAQDWLEDGMRKRNKKNTLSAQSEGRGDRT